MRNCKQVEENLIEVEVTENWPITIAVHRKSGTDPLFLFGGGLLLIIAWSLGTLSGNLLGT